MPCAQAGSVRIMHLSWMALMTQDHVDTEMHKMYANEEGPNPYKFLVQNSPCADIDTVVRGVMTLIQDTSMNGNIFILKQSVSRRELLSYQNSSNIVNSSRGCYSHSGSNTTLWYVMRIKGQTRLLSMWYGM